MPRALVAGPVAPQLHMEPFSTGVTPRGRGEAGGPASGVEAGESVPESAPDGVAGVGALSAGCDAEFLRATSLGEKE